MGVTLCLSDYGMSCLTCSDDVTAEENVKEANGCTMKEESNQLEPEEEENGLLDGVVEKEAGGGSSPQSRATETEQPLPSDSATSPPQWEEEGQGHRIIMCTSSTNNSELAPRQSEEEPDQPASLASNLVKAKVKDEPQEVEALPCCSRSSSPSTDQWSLMVTYPLDLLKGIKNEKDNGLNVESVSAKEGIHLPVEKCEK